MLRHFLILALLSATTAQAAPALEGTVQTTDSPTRFLLQRPGAAPQPVEFPFAARLQQGWLVRVEEPVAQADGSLLADRVMRIATLSPAASLAEPNLPPPVALPDATSQAVPYQPVQSQAALDATLSPPPQSFKVAKKPVAAKAAAKPIAEKPVKETVKETQAKPDDAFSAEAYRAQVKAKLQAAAPSAPPPAEEKKTGANSLFGPGDKRRR